MSGEKDNTSENEEVDNTENYNELDKVLNDDEDGKKEEKEEKESSEENKDKDKDKEKEGEKEKEGDEPDKFIKKVGNREFTSEEDYDKFVLKINGINSNLSGEVKRLGGDPTKIVKGEAAGDVDKKEDKEKTDKKDSADDKKEKPLTDEQQYYRVEKVRFMKVFPKAKEYAKEMALSLSSGKANINDEPSFALALARSLRADNEPIPEKLMRIIKTEKGEDPAKPAAKKVMRSGGSNSASAQSGQETYNEEDKEDLSNFADDVALGNVGPY